MADAGLFTYCGTDARFPVALKGDNAALERAYGSVTHQPGAPVLVTLYGRLEPQMPMEGKLPQDHVIVDRFLQVWPDETCDKVAVEAPLAGTHWRLVELNGQPAAAHEGQEEAHFTLDAGAQRVSGFAGCNRFTGGYRQTGWNLRFSQLASTRMACPNSDDEQVFLKALESVTSYQILGGSLDLRAESGSVARFRAVTETSAGDPPGP
jgi:heat shock protein HslJ